jgi:hypothetical protein
MQIHKTYIAIGLVIAFGLFFELAAHADNLKEQTKITIAQPFQIPGEVLPAGTYIFQQAYAGNPDVIQIFSADGSILEATVETIPTERAMPVGETTVTLARAEPGNPDYLVKLFSPGHTIGHEFIYAKQQEQQVAQAPEHSFAGGHSVSSADATGN